MKVAGIEVGDRPLILAPMEDVTNPPFRKFCKKYGADWLYSEFVSADALVRSVNKSLKKLTPGETAGHKSMKQNVRLRFRSTDVLSILWSKLPKLWRRFGLIL